MVTSARKSKKGPKKPFAESVKTYLLSLGIVIGIGATAHLLDLKDRNFWKTFWLVGFLTPFVLAREAWKKSEEDLENFTIRSIKTRQPMELPEIDLGPDKPRERLGISISKIGETEKANRAMALLGSWEKIEMMKEGPEKEMMKAALKEKADALRDD